MKLHHERQVKQQCRKFPAIEISVKPLFLRKKNCLHRICMEANINGVKIPAIASFDDTDTIAFYDGEWYSTIFETFAPGAKSNERERAKNYVRRELTKAVVHQIAPSVKDFEVYGATSKWGGQLFDVPEHIPAFETEQALDDGGMFRQYLWRNAPATIFTYLLTLRGDDVLHELDAHIDIYSKLEAGNKDLFVSMLERYVKNIERRDLIEELLYRKRVNDEGLLRIQESAADTETRKNRLLKAAKGVFAFISQPIKNFIG